MASKITSQNKGSEAIAANRQTLFRLFKERPMDDEELMVNLSLYMRSGTLAKLLFLDEVYRKILPIPGIICEFGVWMGASLAAYENLRAIHEPYNYSRRIVGFDTFEGYPEVGEKDKASDIIKKGVYTVSKGYEKYLEEVLNYHEQENVMSHVKKHSLQKGDATVTCPKYFEEHPEAVVALAYFDMALYEPTKKVLETIMPRLVKGSIVVLDEFNHPEYPGETEAVRELFDLQKVTITRSQFLPDRCYLVVG